MWRVFQSKHLIMIALLALGLAVPALRAQDLAIAVRSAALELDPADPARDRIGQLRYRGGLILAADGAFGGYSGLVVDPDGGGLWAVSDVGHWLRLDFVQDSGGAPTAVAEAYLRPLRDARGAVLERKALTDAEALRRDARGRWLIAFEREHRIWRYAEPGGPAVENVPLPAGAARQPGNGGIEGLAVLADDDLLLFSEDMPAPGGSAAWLRRGGVWHDLVWPARDGFRPTDAVALPDGDVLLLERFFTPLAGPKARLTRIAAAAIRPGTVLGGTVLAEWARPLSVDNMEALDVRRGADGTLWVYVMSDDNQNGLQRTLLLVFTLDG